MYKLHRIEMEVLEGLWKLGWRYMKVTKYCEIVVYSDLPYRVNGSTNETYYTKYLKTLTPYSSRIEKSENHMDKLIEFLDTDKIYKIGPILKEGHFNVTNQEKYLGGIK